MVFGNVLSLKLLLVLFFLDVTRGNGSGKRDTKSNSIATCELTEVSKADFGRESFIATRNLSGVLTDEKNYTMYVKPTRGFIYVKALLVNADKTEQISLMVDRHFLQKTDTWQQLNLKAEIHPNKERHRWVFGGSSSEYYPRWKRMSILVLSAKGPLTWTDGCDPRISASIVTPTSDDVPTEHLNEVTVALSSVAGIVVFSVVVIIAIQKRRQKRPADEKSTLETTKTTAIAFPNRPVPPIPTKTDSCTISMYSKVCDEDDPVYEEVYESENSLAGKQFRGTLPHVNPQPLKSVVEYPTETDEDKDCSSERDSVNSLYMVAGCRMME